MRNSSNLYSKHLDPAYHKNIQKKFSPEAHLRKFKHVTQHFVERCRERNISLSFIIEIIEKGQKFFVIDDYKNTTYHFLNNHICVEKNGVLMTAFKLYKRRTLEMFLEETVSDTFIFS